MKNFALFSLNDTVEVRRFAVILESLGWIIIATEVPLQNLREVGIQAISVQEFTGFTDDLGFPPTLHPKIEHALTSDQAKEKIELVYDITYGLDIGNDVGGHTLLGLAAKGNRIPVSSFESMKEVIEILEKDKMISNSKRKELIDKSNWEIASHFTKLLSESNKYVGLNMVRDLELLNGENPYQIPADFMKNESNDALGLHNFHFLGDNKPCFVNMADADCIIETLNKLMAGFECNRGKIPYITVAAKHGNACGVGVDWSSPSESIDKALWGNSIAIWGGEVAVNFPLGAEEGALLYSSERRKQQLGGEKWMLDVVLAPEINEGGQSALGRRKSTKLMVNPSLNRPLILSKWDYRFVRGGVLRQPYPSFILNLKQADWVGEKLSEIEMDSLIIAWATAYTSMHGGNEVAIAAENRLLGVGGGPSTVEAAEIAVMRSSKFNKELLKRSVFAADAFFPFTDGPEILINAGCFGGVVPSGGIRIKEVIKYFSDKKVCVAILDGKKRGFCRH
jgi:phosphoribosylaminoimidazolecarboxamide formyltransferase / IMP cyclohydrolase